MADYYAEPDVVYAEENGFDVGSMETIMALSGGSRAGLNPTGQDCATWNAVSLQVAYRKFVSDRVLIDPGSSSYRFLTDI